MTTILTGLVLCVALPCVIGCIVLVAFEGAILLCEGVRSLFQKR